MNSNTIVSKPTESTILGIKERIYVGFATLAFLLLLAMLFMLFKITAVETSSTEVVKVNLPSQNLAFNLNIQLYAAQSALKNWLLLHDPKAKADFSNAWHQIDNLEISLNKLIKKNTDTSLSTGWEEAKSLIKQLKLQQAKVIIQEPNTATIALYSETIPLVNKIFDFLDGPVNALGDRKGGIFDILFKQLEEGSANIISTLDNMKIIEYSLLTIGILASFLIAFLTVRTISLHINNFRQHSSRIASGDLTQRLAVNGKDDLAQLGHDLNIMTESLATIANKISDSCHKMVTTIEEVKHSVDVQSSGATEQASSINQITASLDEIEKSSSQTIGKAKTLGDIAERTREKGQQGLQAVEQSMLGMKDVREKVQVIAQTILDLSNQTQQVGEITAVVNTLAQQSKMLALNASIEAAKAGEAGKGFAVVAAEVKNLAEQSEQSTTQVQKILEDIRHATEKAVMATEEGTKGVDQGTGLVEQTGEVVRSLSDVIHETTIASQQIEAAIRQEGIGIEQITAGMNEINQVTTSFVESVNQTTEAIQHLVEIAKDLRQYVEIYKT